MTDQPATPPEGDEPAATRRRLLMLGAVSASAVVTIRPAMAQAAASVLNCQIPIPDPSRAGYWIAQDGSLVPPNTAGAVPGASRPVTGEEVRAALQGSSFPGTDAQTSQAYKNYIRQLRSGMSGFTCYASLQMPRG